MSLLTHPHVIQKLYDFLGTQKEKVQYNVDVALLHILYIGKKKILII